jgi:hypothetical protein
MTKRTVTARDRRARYNPLKWPRWRRRQVTLAKAKELIRQEGYPRSQLRTIQATLMDVFPDGTIDRAEAR